MVEHLGHPHFRTIVEPAAPPLSLELASRILLLGSCFADRMGQAMADRWLPVTANPYGVIYHPLPLAQLLERLLDERPYEVADLTRHRERWYSLDHHGQFAADSPDDLLELLAAAYTAASQALAEADLLVITLGTAWGWWHHGSGRWAANCHRLPASQFSRRLVRTGALQEIWQPLVARLRRERPGCRVVLTVSPVRHLRDDAPANQVSKAQLLSLCWELCHSNELCRYFPAYEILMDDLRDYRYYDDDMCHPSRQAVGYIWDIFRHWCYVGESERYLAEWQGLAARLHHRHRQPLSPAASDFASRTHIELAEFRQRYPFARTPSPEEPS